MRAFIFDLDGVILSTDEFHFRAWSEIAKEENLTFNRDINNKLRGISRAQSLQIILDYNEKHYDDEEKSRLIEKKNEIYKQLLAGLNQDSITPAVIKTIEEIKKAGYKIAIGSSSKNATDILKRCKIHDLFDAVSDGNNISRSKPDPEVFLKATEMMSVLPTETYVVEDACSGIDAANAGGFVSIGINDASEYHKADYSVSRFEDLLSFI
ncbi:MAG: beta-phosphoglucomutase [Erysipelotrichaceae bacterium]|nr:beta-phosphoglucomutase [Erysipelotrichaceae bacterium]